MAERRRVIPARKRDVTPDDADSLLLRSAESLGRVIGSLQRELQRTAARLNGGNNGAAGNKARKTAANRTTRKRTSAKRMATTKRTAKKK